MLPGGGGDVGTPEGGKIGPPRSAYDLQLRRRAARLMLAPEYESRRRRRRRERELDEVIGELLRVADLPPGEESGR